MLALIASWGLLTLGPAAASAEVLGLDIDNSGIAFTPPNNFTIGWTFTTTGPIIIEALGYWDEGSNGLSDDHAVGLWTTGGTLLASTTVTATSSLLAASESGLGQWIFEPIAPLALDPVTYVIGGFTNFAVGDVEGECPVGGSATFDCFRLGVTTATLNAELGLTSFGSARLSDPDVPGLVFPLFSEPSTNLSFFGPNFLATPEPSTALLLGLGVLGLAVTRQRRTA